MIEQIVSLLTGILKELTALRVSYDAALAGVHGEIAAAGQAAENTKPVEKAKEQAPAPEPFPLGATAAQAAASAPAAVAAPTREQCGQALVELATTKNRDSALAVLGKFNAKLVKEVQEKDLLPFYTAIQEALK